MIQCLININLWIFFSFPAFETELNRNEGEGGSGIEFDGTYLMRRTNWMHFSFFFTFLFVFSTFFLLVFLCFVDLVMSDDELRANNNIIDGDVDQFDKETDEAHYTEAHGGGDSNLLEFLAIGLRATFHQTNGVLGKGASWFTEFHYFIHGRSVFVLWDSSFWNLLSLKKTQTHKIPVNIKKFRRTSLVMKWMQWRIPGESGQQRKVKM